MDIGERDHFLDVDLKNFHLYENNMNSPSTSKDASINSKGEMNQDKTEVSSEEESNLLPEYFFKVGNLEEQGSPRVEVGKMSKDELNEMRQIFNVFDSDLNGQITANELRHVIRCLGQSTTEAEIMDMMHSIDSDGNGVIEFPEFIALISSKVKNIRNTDQLDKVFKIFDTDATDEINASNLQKMFDIFGYNTSERDIKEMLKEADSDMDGKVGFEDFVKMMSQ